MCFITIVLDAFDVFDTSTAAYYSLVLTKNTQALTHKMNCNFGYNIGAIHELGRTTNLSCRYCEEEETSLLTQQRIGQRAQIYSAPKR